MRELAEKRYSCRSFSGKKVDGELISRMIDTAILAPTAVNRQSYQIFRLDSEKAKDAVRRASGCTYGADTFLIVGYKEADGWVRPSDGRNFADIDAGIVGTHLILAATDLGLNITWVGNFDSEKLQAEFPAMRDYQLVALFPIGYAAEDGGPSEQHFSRKSKEELVTVL